jgi:hypothetical protein
VKLLTILTTGNWEFITKDAAPIMGTTKMENGVTAEELKRPRRTEPLHPLHKMPDGTRAGDMAAISPPLSERNLNGGAVTVAPRV